MREECRVFVMLKQLLNTNHYPTILFYIIIGSFIFALTTVLCLHHAVLKLNTVLKFGVGLYKCARCKCHAL